ncbi:murein biosynthesis integral membrane protein MurJ [Patescibacteria group bacterium]|nr:murein biosynthesis integral membrane protein MurJ [Patescibacteria group bacterium]
MVKRLINAQINSITLAAALVAVSSLISRVLGIFRDRILAGEFGAGDTLDVYFAAFRVPDMVYNLIVLGALSAGFIPIFTELLQKKDAKSCEVIQKGSHVVAWEFTNNLVNLLLIVLVGLSVVGLIFMPYLMKIIAPGFSAEKLSETIGLARIMLLSPIILGISGVAGGVLQSFKRFFVFSLSPIMYNVGIIIGALFFVPVWGVYGLAYGVVFGACLHLFIQLPAIFALGFRYRIYINLSSNKIRKIGRLMIPRLMSLGVVQINLLVITVIASILPSGSLSIFNLANNLAFFPIGIFGISFAVAAFPALSSYATNNELFIRTFSKTFRNILFFIVPSTVVLMTLKAQIVRVILGTGNFDWSDTILTLEVLEFFAISLFAQATVPLLARMFFALKDSKTPFFVGLGSAILNVFLSYYFSRKMGVAGLALAFSLASIFNFIFLWILLRVKAGYLDEGRILASVIKFSAAAVGCGIVIQFSKGLVVDYVDMDKLWGVLVQGGIASVFGLLAYLLLCYIFRSKELFHFFNVILRRFN